ncbi:predicted protein [Chaetoceros tenuissimus]|uniref:Uncharacterized protein n=1 Tax=Chaetoceros tenuissimus TaxID=426638 RepID=A0AAD3CEH7_9STRA|nr:predicted protein [Chaetoceros tenuissimus]
MELVPRVIGFKSLSAASLSAFRRSHHFSFYIVVLRIQHIIHEDLQRRSLLHIHCTSFQHLYPSSSHHQSCLEVCN